MRSDLASVLAWAAAIFRDWVASAEMCFLINLKAGSLRSECSHSVGAGSFPGLQMAAFSPCPPVHGWRGTVLGPPVLSECLNASSLACLPGDFPPQQWI